MRFAWIFAALWVQPLSAQPQSFTVCQALNSAANRQLATIHAILGGGALFEGRGSDPCPGWPRRFFTAPSVIPIMNMSYAGVIVPDGLLRANLSFLIGMRMLQKTNLSTLHKVAASGVLIRKPWLLSFRSSSGAYAGWGEGLDGGYAALLVVTSPILNE